MDSATYPDLRLVRELAEWPEGAVVSIYVPVDPAHRDVDRVSLKASLQWAGEELVARHHFTPADAAALTAAADMPAAMQSGTVVWFLGRGRGRCVLLPEPVGPATVVGEVADVMGLLPYLGDNGAYFVLALSQHRVRLFRASRYRIDPVTVPDLPKSLEEALWFVHREPTFERHGSGAMHASGGGREWHKDDMQRFVQLVDEAVLPVLRGSTAPLVVLGVGYEAAMFVNVSRYRHVVREPVEGNPDSLDADQVHERSWAVAKDRVSVAGDLLAKARELLGTGMAVSDAVELRTAAVSGAVGSLLVTPAATAVPTVQRELGAEREALCRAVLSAAASGAGLFVAPDDRLPGGGAAVALLRR
jgi:hypothetical protein